MELVLPQRLKWELRSLKEPILLTSNSFFQVLIVCIVTELMKYRRVKSIKNSQFLWRKKAIEIVDSSLAIHFSSVNYFNSIFTFQLFLNRLTQIRVIDRDLFKRLPFIIHLLPMAYIVSYTRIKARLRKK